jgi:hypothetical protein
MSGWLLAQGQLYASYWPNIMEGPLSWCGSEFWNVKPQFYHNNVNQNSIIFPYGSSFGTKIFNMFLYFYVSIACCGFFSLCLVLYVFYVSKYYVSIACFNFVSLCVVWCLLCVYRVSMFPCFNVFMFLDSIHSINPFIQ